MGLLIVKSNTQLIEEDKKTSANAAVPPAQSPAVSSLSAFLDKAWEAAKKEKIPFERQMLKNMRARDNEYEPDKLSAIKAIGAPEIFMGVTESKTRSCEAWVKDILFQPNNIPWDIEPTPVPELPAGLQEQITARFYSEAMSFMVSQSVQTGQPIDAEQIIGSLQAKVPEFQKKIKYLILEKAKEKTKEMKEKMNDQLTEGGWYDAVDDFIPDVIVHTGIIKGPMLRRDYLRRVKTNDKGIMSVTTVSENICQYEARGFLNIYPGPGSTGINSGYLFDRLPYTPQDIQSMIGLPGFIESELRAVLRECDGGKLRDWTLNDTEKASAQGLNPDSINEWEEVDCLEYWGTIKAKLLHEFDSDGSMKWKEKAPDKDLYYNVNILKIGTHIIKASLNKDPRGCKPYCKLSFIERPGSFWGKGLPEVIDDTQTSCNACARALLYNVGMASGPQVEINSDRLASGEKADLVPWKRWFVSNDEMMNGGKAIEFYTPPLVAQQLIQVFNFYLKLADEHSGVPAYAHGDPQVGGAGNTASGLSMLMTQAARGIKLLIKNLDKKVIEDTLQRQFWWNIERKEMAGLIGDVRIVAKGSSSLIAKEQQASRMTELLSITANPIDAQIMGLDGRKKLLREVIRTHEMDPEAVIPEFSFAALAQTGDQALSGPGAAPLAKPANLNAAGEPTQGTDFQTVNARGGAASKPRVEGHVAM